VIPACLVCSQQVSVVNKYNIRRQYETHHAEIYRGLSATEEREGKGTDSRLEKPEVCFYQ